MKGASRKVRIVGKASSEGTIISMLEDIWGLSNILIMTALVLSSSVMIYL